MSDHPYVTGFLEEIIAVNFEDGNWLAVYSIPDQNATVNLTVEFPNDRGFSPLQWCFNNFAPPYAIEQPRTLDKNSLKEKHGGYTTFAVKEPLTVGAPADIVLSFIRLTGALASGSHIARVRFNVFGGHGSNQPFSIAMFSAKDIVAGYKIPASGLILDPLLLPGVKGHQFFAYNSSEVDDFRINSKNLTVDFA